MKKQFAFALILVWMLTVLSGCGCDHEWAPAACEVPSTCTLCGKTEGEALGHSFGEATCAAPSTCSGCGATQGEALPHTFGEATCSAPSTCSGCGATQGEALPHTLTAANFQQAPQCTVCGAEEGEPVTPGFEALGISVHYGQIGVPSSITVQGSAFEVGVSAHEVFESDSTHEAMDGYVWHRIEVNITALENQSSFGYNLPTYTDFNSYYDPEGLNGSIYPVDNGTLLSLAFTVNYYGEDFDSCIFQLEDSYLDNANGQWNYHETICIRLPAGYDGMLYCIGDAMDAQGQYSDAWKNFYSSENTVFFHIQ